MKFPWAQLSALAAKPKSSTSNPATPPKRERRAQTPRSEHPGQRDATADIVRHVRVAGRLAREADADAHHNALAHLQKACQLASVTNSPVLHLETVQRFVSIERIFTGDQSGARELYPKGLPPGISAGRRCVERAVLTLQSRELRDADLVELRFDLAGTLGRMFTPQPPDPELSRVGSACLAACYVRLEMWPEAVVWLERARTHGDDAALALVYAYYYLGEQLSMHAPGRAVECWKEAVRAHPDPALSSVLIALHVRLEEYEQALGVCERVLNRRPGNTSIQTIRGLLLLLNERAESAYGFLLPLAYDTGDSGAMKAIAIASGAMDIRGEEVWRELGAVLKQGGYTKSAWLAEWETCIRSLNQSGRPWRAHVVEALDEMLQTSLAQSSKAPEVPGAIPQLPSLSWWIVGEGVDSDDF